GCVKYLNPVAESLTGWTLSEALNRPIEEVYSLRTEDGQAVEQCQLRRALRSGYALERKRFVLAGRNRQVTVEDSTTPIRDTQDRLAGAVTVILDVTEQQRAEQERERLMKELQRSNAELARFSYAVSHDLQAPVRTVHGFTQLLAERLQRDCADDNAELLKHIKDAVARMQRLIESLLKYAQVGHGQLKRERVAFTDVVQDVTAVLAGLISETHAEIKCGSLPSVVADKLQLEQLMQNLLANAMKYRQAEQVPRIYISAEPCREGWQFAVADNGEGIPPEELGRIFEALHRLHGAETPGSGIGLALCRSIIERHGGRIWAESPGVGRGATFRFVLPRK
ncbi:MAG: PAS domain S-box protein, partial [Acidobacteriaceae bacterium]|nr:PAS domain S-box protein [Acidobacteriaceae bacterium]